MCVALLYIMLRMWSNWRAVASVSSSDGEETASSVAAAHGKWCAGDGKYWKVGSVSVASSAAEEKYSSASSETTSVLHGKPAEAAGGGAGAVKPASKC